MPTDERLYTVPTLHLWRGEGMALVVTAGAGSSRHVTGAST